MKTLYSFVAFLSLLLAGCGQDYCFSGLGNCGKYAPPNGTTSGTNPAQGLTMTLDASPIASGTATTVRVAGGISPYYLSIVDVSGNQYTDASAGTLNSTSQSITLAVGTNSASYNAPTIAANTSSSYYIKLKDTQGTIITKEIVVKNPL